MIQLCSSVTCRVSLAVYCTLQEGQKTCQSNYERLAHFCVNPVYAILDIAKFLSNQG